MEQSSLRNIIILLVIGLILAGVAFYLRYRATREEPPPPGYYTGPMLPKSQRMGMPGMPPPAQSGTGSDTGSNAPSTRR